MTLTSAPVLQVLVAFTGSTETDITSDVRRCTITRGRSRERETMSPGRAEIDLWNYAGKYDPDNTAGIYYPNIRPNKTVRILAFTDSATSPFTMGSSAMGGGGAFGGGGYYEFPIFTGRLEGGTLSYAEGGLQPTVIWRAVDASKRLNRDRSTTGWGTAGELTGERVTAVLDGATPTWPATERDIAAGTKTVQYEAGDQGRYDYLLQVAQAEPGAFFISAAGYAVFRDSTWAPTPATPALGSAPDEYAFSEIEITDDESEIYNAVTVTANAVADQVEEDLGSQAEFGRSDLSVSTVLDTTADMDDLALTYLIAYSSPRRRVSSLRVDRSAADWRFFLEKELLDRVIVRHRPVYSGTFQQTSAIQGIQVKVDGSQRWELTWNLSPPLDIISNPNLLTDNQSSMETSTGGWVYDTGYGYIAGREGPGSNALIGDWCLQMTSYDYNPPGEYVTTPYTTVPVTVGHTYRASAWVRSHWQSMAGTIYIDFLNSGGTQIGQSPYVASCFVSTETTTEWVNMTTEGIAPSGAAYARVRVRMTEFGGLGRPMYLDGAELRDTLVISPTTVYPATIQAQAVLPAPTITATPQNRTVSVSTIARAAALPTPTVSGSTPFVPTDIAGIQAWWDFSDISVLYQTTSTSLPVTTDGETIGRVNDKSGLGVNLLQVTASIRPTYKTAIINGKSVGRFDGSNDEITGTIPADASQTVFVVLQKRSIATSVNQVAFDFLDSSAASVGTDTDDGSGYIYGRNNVFNRISIGGTVTNTNVIVLKYTDTSNLNIYLNGGAAAVSAMNPDDAYSVSTSFRLGVGGSSDIDVGEVIIYNSTLSLANVNNVGNYLAAKWGFTWTTAT